jgi:hypothetical protein
MSWLEERENLTPEVKESLSKFDSEDAALTGYYELQKSAGKPFKLPKSMDKLPDDETRSKFTAQARELLEIEDGIKSADDVKDVNFAEDLADARVVNEEFKKNLIDFAIEKKMPKSLLAALVKFENQQFTKHDTAQTNAIEAAKTEAENKVSEALGTLYGGDAGIKRNNENVRKMLTNNAGLDSVDGEAASALVEKLMKISVPFSKAVYNISKDYAESTTEPGGRPGERGKEPTGTEGLEKTGAVLGWNK